MVNCRDWPFTEMVFTPEVTVGALLQPELRAAVARVVRLVRPRKRVERSIVLVEGATPGWGQRWRVRIREGSAVCIDGIYMLNGEKTSAIAIRFSQDNRTSRANINDTISL